MNFNWVLTGVITFVVLKANVFGKSIFKGLQEVKTLAQELRVLVSEAKKKD